MDDVQSWWEVPCIAHFCSLFRSSFDLLDFDIEELEEALLTHTVEEVGSSLIQELIVRLLKGCFKSSKDEITSSNYQMYLRRLFRIKCEEDERRKNPFDLDVAFHSLPLRTKVEILYDLCDFRLDGDEVQETLKSLESHSLRVTALGKDSGGSAYWYFYGTRLYREDYNTSPTSSPAKKRGKKSKAVDENVCFDALIDSKWQVVCFTEEDWHLLTSKFKNCRSKNERSLHRTLKEDFLPELPRLFAEKEKMQRKRMLEQQLRRSNRSNASVNSGDDGKTGDETRENLDEDEQKRQRLEQEKADRLLAEEIHREERQARIRLRDRRGVSSGVSNGGGSEKSTSGSKTSKKHKGSDKGSKKKRMTNNSMAACLPADADPESNDDSALGQKSVSYSTSSPQSGNSEGKGKESSSSTKIKKANDEQPKPKKEKEKEAKELKGKGKGKTKIKSSAIFSSNDEDVLIGMHKVIEAVKNHRDAWPFVNPVDEEYAPNYYRVISSPMDILTIEDKLDNQDYSCVEEFKDDFQKIVDNCKKYNGISSEYTEMVETLQEAFSKALRRYIVPDESDDEITIEYSEEKKKSKSHSKHKNSPKVTEHKKENEPTLVKTSKTKLDKGDKKKRNKELLRHHGKNSVAMDALNSATAETLKDINKWLGDSPKIPDYSSSVSTSYDDPIAPDNGKISELEKTVQKSLKQLKKNRSRSDADRVDAHLRMNEKGISKEKRSKVHKLRGKSKDKDSLKSKDSKSKHHHHNHHKRHRHEERSNSSSSKISKCRSSSPECDKSYEPKPKKLKDSKDHKSKNQTALNSYKNITQSPVNSNKFSTEDSVGTKQAEKSKLKSPIKKSAPKFSMGMKRFQGNKNHKSSSMLQDSKKFVREVSTSGASVYDFGSYKSLSGSSEVSAFNQSTGGAGALKDNTLDKKKCLLIIDSPKGSEGGPKLSLGSVLASDDIKLGNYKSDNLVDDDDDEVFPKTSKVIKDRFDDLKEKVHGKESDSDKCTPDNTSPVKASDPEPEVKTDDESEQPDRKLEPSKGFNRDKSLPNLSAWIKAFGGPAKNTSNVSPNLKKSEPDPKSKFKVLGRVPDIPEEKGKHGNKSLSGIHKLQGSHQMSSSLTKPYQGSHSNNDETTANHLTVDNVDQAGSTSHKRHRSRKVSCSSLSSQSEAGSPSCFPAHVDDGNSRIAINPPRWVDEHWGPSQSPSASSHVSSQSPAGPNSPFSPPASSPPRTPQTPPWPPAPVRVGFYQDLTLQHPSPEKSTESSSNVSSPNPGNSTSNNSARPGSREHIGRDGYSYSHSNFGHRQGESVPSPSVNPSADMPSPGMNISVDSPSNRSGSMGSADSPQSPSTAHVTVQSVEKTRGGHSKRSESPAVTHYNMPQPRSSGPYTSQETHLGAPPTSMRSASNTPTAMNLNVNANLSAPISMVSSSTKSGYMSEPGNHHSGHGLGVYHDNLHSSNQQPAHSSGKYPAPAHRQPPGINHDHPGISVSNSSLALPNHSVIVSGIPSSVLPTNLSSNLSQPVSYATSGYGQNTKGMLSVTGAGSINANSESRYYKGSIGSSIMSASVAHGATAPTSRGRKSNAANHASSASSNKGGSPMGIVGSPVPGVSPDVAVLEGKLGPEINVNGLQWPHNLASLTQIVNSIPNPMALGSPGLPGAYRAHFDANVANAVENMTKYQHQRFDSYAAANSKSGGSGNSSDMQGITSLHEKPQSGEGGSDRRSSKAEHKSSRSQVSGKSSAQSMGTSGAFNFAALPPDIAMYSKEMSESNSLYGSSSPSLAHHRSELYPTSTANFHPAFAAASAVKTTAGGVPTASIPPYQIPPFIGSHPSPYQPQSVSSQPSPFSHAQGSRGIVDPYQQFFPGSPHVMGLLPPTSYAAPYTHPHHSLGFNRPGWI